MALSQKQSPGFPGSMTCTFSHTPIPKSCHCPWKTCLVMHGRRGTARMIRSPSFWSLGKRRFRIGQGGDRDKAGVGTLTPDILFWSSVPCYHLSRWSVADRACPISHNPMSHSSDIVPYTLTQGTAMEREPKTNVH